MFVRESQTDHHLVMTPGLPSFSLFLLTFPEIRCWNGADHELDIFRRDIVFPGEIFPDSSSSPDWDTSDTRHEEKGGKVSKNKENDGKPGVMTRW